MSASTVVLAVWLFYVYYDLLLELLIVMLYSSNVLYTLFFNEKTTPLIFGHNIDK